MPKPQKQRKKDPSDYHIQLDILTQEMLGTILNTVCPVCQEAFRVGSEAAGTKCNHVYHAECLGTWLSQNDMCPLCKNHLDRNDYLDLRGDSKKRLERQQLEANNHQGLQNSPLHNYYLGKG